MGELPKMPKLKREYVPYIMTAIIMILDIVLVLLLSLVTVDFDFSQLKSSSFWADYCATLAVTLIAYYGTIGSGEKQAKSKESYGKLLDTLDKKRNFVSLNFLEDRRDAYIDQRNRVEKLRAYLVAIDYKLTRCKDDNKRNIIKSEKAVVLATLKLESAKIDAVVKNTMDADEKETCEKIIQASDFNIDSMKNVEYRKIDKRVISTGLSTLKTGTIGGFNKSLILSVDSIKKVAFSVIGTVLLSMLLNMLTNNQGEVTADVIFAFMGRLMMVVINGYSGYTEGVKLVEEHQEGAIKEQILIHNEFIFWCESFCIIKRKVMPVEQCKEASQ